ncbi:MAG: hypothetical protein R3F31_14730 [Verrucomicrobiales bacterium]
MNEQDGTVTLVDATPDGFKSNGSFVLDPQAPDAIPRAKSGPILWSLRKLYLRDQEFIKGYDVKGRSVGYQALWREATLLRGSVVGATQSCLRLRVSAGWLLR